MYLLYKTADINHETFNLICCLVLAYEKTELFNINNFLIFPRVQTDNTKHVVVVGPGPLCISQCE